MFEETKIFLNVLSECLCNRKWLEKPASKIRSKTPSGHLPVFYLIQSNIFLLKTKHKIIHIYFFFFTKLFYDLSSIFLDFLFLPTPFQFSPPQISTQYRPDTIYCSVNCISVFFWYFFFWFSNKLQQISNWRLIF